MNRRKFLGISGGVPAAAGTSGYLLSDRDDFTRTAIADEKYTSLALKQDEKEILYLASLAPSGHNTQPWLVKYIEPYHWIICNDKTKWLPAVDPLQRETVLSLGAFIQNLEYAANNSGYSCHFTLLAQNNQDEHVMEVQLVKTNTPAFDITKIKNRRTVRSNYLKDVLKKEDETFLLKEERDNFYFVAPGSKSYQWLNEQTIEANRIQAYRNAAQQELSDWIRFSSDDAKNHANGITTASMEVGELPGWIPQNFYNNKSILTKKFREQGIDKVKEQVSASAGWLLITSKGNTVAALLETGKCMERLFVKVRDKNIAIHPMTQILEETATQKIVNQSLGITDNIQFILRLGYLQQYPEPVSLRRPVSWFVKT
jgi:hypothetical protein